MMVYKGVSQCEKDQQERFWDPGMTNFWGIKEEMVEQRDDGPWLGIVWEDKGKWFVDGDGGINVKIKSGTSRGRRSVEHG